MYQTDMLPCFDTQHSPGTDNDRGHSIVSIEEKQWNVIVYVSSQQTDGVQ